MKAIQKARASAMKIEACVASRFASRCSIRNAVGEPAAGEEARFGETVYTLLRGVRRAARNTFLCREIVVDLTPDLWYFVEVPGISDLAPTSPMPSFFLAGAPKAGTTALYRYLDQHPRIYMSPIKEPNFFADEFRLENFGEHFRKIAELRLPAQAEYLQGPVAEKFSGGPVSEWADYLKLFQGARQETAIGEASVCYLWSESAPRNIAARFPDAKILMVLRNPIERAFSQYAHMLSFADSPVTFREYVDAAIHSGSTRISELYPFLKFGLYHEQLERYFSLFDRGQIQIHFYENFTRDPASVLSDIFRFLSVDADFAPDMSDRHMEAAVPRSFFLKKAIKQLAVWDTVRDLLPKALRTHLRSLVFQPRGALKMSPADRAFLAEYYRDDTTSLSKLLQRDLSHWLA